MWTTAPAIGADLVAIAVLARAVYFTRHRPRDLMLAYTALNLGFLAVSAVLTATHAGIGLGLGLFGILSIIRLRSSAITQEALGVAPVSVSKYCLAVALLDPRVRANRWNHILRRQFGWRRAAAPLLGTAAG